MRPETDKSRNVLKLQIFAHLVVLLRFLSMIEQPDAPAKHRQA